MFVGRYTLIPASCPLGLKCYIYKVGFLIGENWTCMVNLQGQLCPSGCCEKAMEKMNKSSTPKLEFFIFHHGPKARVCYY